MISVPRKTIWQNYYVTRANRISHLLWLWQHWFFWLRWSILLGYRKRWWFLFYHWFCDSWHLHMKLVDYMFFGVTTQWILTLQYDLWGGTSVFILRRRLWAIRRFLRWAWGRVWRAARWTWYWRFLYIMTFWRWLRQNGVNHKKLVYEKTFTIWLILMVYLLGLSYMWQSTIVWHQINDFFYSETFMQFTKVYLSVLRWDWLGGTNFLDSITCWLRTLLMSGGGSGKKMRGAILLDNMELWFHLYRLWVMWQKWESWSLVQVQYWSGWAWRLVQTHAQFWVLTFGQLLQLAITFVLIPFTIWTLWLRGVLEWIPVPDYQKLEAQNWPQRRAIWFIVKHVYAQGKKRYFRGSAWAVTLETWFLKELWHLVLRRYWKKQQIKTFLVQSDEWRRWMHFRWRMWWAS